MNGNDEKVSYQITITRYWQGEGEVGCKWCPTGKKKEDGSDEYGYTPSQIGITEKSKQVLSQYVEGEVDVAAIQRILNRKPKA